MADPIRLLVEALGRLPGIGEKTATRLAYFILREPAEYARDLSRAILEVKERIRLCSVCCDLTEEDPCRRCRSADRDEALLCVVARPQDIFAIERSGGFAGRFHVLHGVLAPLEGIGPDDLKVRELLTRLEGGSVREVIVATGPNVEGEATALYLAKLLKPLGVKVSRLATGLPVGAELEFADATTLCRALEARREI